MWLINFAKIRIHDAKIEVSLSNPKNIVYRIFNCLFVGLLVHNNDLQISMLLQLAKYLLLSAG